MDETHTGFVGEGFWEVENPHSPAIAGQALKGSFIDRYASVFPSFYILHFLSLTKVLLFNCGVNFIIAPPIYGGVKEQSVSLT